MQDKGPLGTACQTQSQLQNGLARLGVKTFKEMIKKATDGRLMSTAGLLTSLQRVACITKNRPFGVKALDDKVVVTPNMLLLRKTSSATDRSNRRNCGIHSALLA